MFIRVKTSPNSRGKSVQIVQSIRKGERVTQKIIRHVGMAYDEIKVSLISGEKNVRCYI